VSATPTPPPSVALEHRRRHLPAERRSVTKKLTISYLDYDAPQCADGSQPPLREIDLYIIVGLYEDGTPGELFVEAGKTGAMVSGLLEAFGIAVSIALQSGVELAWFTSKLKGMSFEPAGATSDPRIRSARSIIDGVARWLEIRFLGGGDVSAQ